MGTFVAMPEYRDALQVRDAGHASQADSAALADAVSDVRALGVLALALALGLGGVIRWVILRIRSKVGAADAWLGIPGAIGLAWGVYLLAVA